MEKAEVSPNNIIPKVQRNKAQRSFQPVKALRKMRDFIFLTSEAQRNFGNELFDSIEAQRNYGTAFSYQVKAQPNFRNWNFTTQLKYSIFAILDRKRGTNLQKKADIYHCYDRNGTKLSSMYKIALFSEKNFEGAAQLKRNKF